MKNIPFYNKTMYLSCLEDIKVLEDMASTMSDDEMVAIGELSVNIITSRRMCVGRYCGTCDGVRCENAYFGDIPEYSSRLKAAAKAYWKSIEEE